jgi:bifunctional UDP-N-acetylglucosamine pyrophosphorylase/glucosamine-1-phosphate N-acetyltransferase
MERAGVAFKGDGGVESLPSDARVDTRSCGRYLPLRMSGTNDRPVAVVLAAGLGTRMRSSLAKVLHPLVGRPMLAHVVGAAREVSKETVVVVHHQAEAVATAVAAPDVRFVSQGSPKGTGHALRAAVEAIEGSGTLLVLSGDAPLLTAATLKKLLDAHDGKCTVMTTELDHPGTYGRVARDPLRIVEAAEATPQIQSIREINTGTYALDLDWARTALAQLQPHAPKNELYLTDLVQMAGDARTVLHPDATELLGVNDRWALARANRILQERILERHARAGVTFLNPESTIVEHGVTLGDDVTIGPAAVLRGGTRVASGVTIGPAVVLTDAEIGEAAEIRAGTVVERSRVGPHAVIGPMAHIKEGSDVGSDTTIGNFVEVKKSKIAHDVKAKHLSYIGDATVGPRTNVGAGTIVCNYDGFQKHETRIGADVFVGSDSVLVAPIAIGDAAFVAAGSVLVEDVGAGELAIGRARQVHKPGGAEKLKLEKGKR